MEKYDELKKELDELLEEGKKLADSLSTKQDYNKLEDFAYFFVNYEQWYSKALILVKFLLPDRKEDFISFYKLEKRKEIDIDTYTISDALRSLSAVNKRFGPRNARSLIYSQCCILEACKQQFDSKICNIKTLLQADIFDSEIDSAQYLSKLGYLRAAGAICGVVIEKHLTEVCINRGIKLKKKSPTIADLNEALKDNAYDVIEWRKIQHLGDIRNICDHQKNREPQKEEVEDLIRGTEWLIKTIF